MKSELEKFGRQATDHDVWNSVPCSRTVDHAEPWCPRSGYYLNEPSHSVHQFDSRLSSFIFHRSSSFSVYSLLSVAKNHSSISKRTSPIRPPVAPASLYS